MMWSLIPLPWRIGAGVALLAVAGWAFMRYRASLIEEGMARGRVQQQKEDAKRLEQQTAAAQAEIDGLRQALSISQTQNAQERASLRQVRVDMGRGLDEALAKIQAGKEVCDVTIAAVPDAQLDAAIRAQLQRLSGGGAAPAPHD